MPCQPRMLEPSKPRPSSKTPSSSLATGMVKCCDVPRRSVNRKSTALTSFSRHRARTSRGVIARVRGSGFGGRGSGFGVRARNRRGTQYSVLSTEYSVQSTKKKREAIIAPRSFFLVTITHHSLTHHSLLDKQHLLIRRQRPEIVGDVAFKLVGELADLRHRGQHVVAILLGFV